MKYFKYLLVLIIFFIGCKNKTLPPKLVVFISVDQLSEEMFEHYSDLYTGGYKWLIDNGIWYTNIDHEHWYTTTGPGHFVLGSGQHPTKGGVIGNYYYHRLLDKTVYCVDDTLACEIGNDKKSFSYGQVHSTTIGDWLKNKYPKSKVFSVSGKDRAAILLAGKNPDLAIWYNWRGEFVSSDYYADKYPNWLINFNNNSNLARYQDSIWVRELDENIYDKYTRPDYFVGEYDTFDKTKYSPVFPIGIDDLTSVEGVKDHEGDEYVVDHLGDGPWLDYETLNLAKVIFTEENLGQDNNPDILFVGLSSTDVVGHNQGPYSHEAMDNQLKIDKNLKSLFSSIENRMDLKDVLFILTSDHGTIPLPEYLIQYKEIEAGRIDRQLLNETYRSIDDKVINSFGENLYKRFSRRYFYNHELLKERGVKKSELDDIIKSEFDQLEGIGYILTKDEILNADTNDKVLQRFKNFTDPILSPDIIAVPKEFWTTRFPLGATHGTPYNYDSNVPLIITQKGKTSSQVVTDTCATVDIAPTIAKMLGIKPLNKVDGNSLF